MDRACSLLARSWLAPRLQSAAKKPTAVVLVSGGANANARAVDEETPLMFAARGGHTHVVKYLLANGSDPTLTNIYHETAADMSKDGAIKFDDDILMCLAEANGDFTSVKERLGWRVRDGVAGGNYTATFGGGAWETTKAFMGTKAQPYNMGTYKFGHVQQHYMHGKYAASHFALPVHSFAMPGCFPEAGGIPSREAKEYSVPVGRLEQIRTLERASSAAHEHGDEDDGSSATAGKEETGREKEGEGGLQPGP